MTTLQQRLWRAVVDDEALRPMRVLCAAWNKCQRQRPGWEDCKLRHWQIPVELFVQQVLSRVKVDLLRHTPLRIPASVAMHALCAELQTVALLEMYDPFAGKANVADYCVHMSHGGVASIGYFVPEGARGPASAIALVINFALPCKVVRPIQFMQRGQPLPHSHVYGRPRSQQEIQQRWDAYQELAVPSSELLDLAHLVQAYAHSDVRARLVSLDFERKVQLVVEAHGLRLRVHAYPKILRNYGEEEGHWNNTMAFVMNDALLMLVDTHALHVEALLVQHLPPWVECAESIYNPNLYHPDLCPYHCHRPQITAVTDHMVDQLCERCYDHVKDMALFMQQEQAQQLGSAVSISKCFAQPMSHFPL